MRSFLGLAFVGSVVALSFACTTENIIVQPAPSADPAAEDGGVEDPGTADTGAAESLVIDLGEVATGADVSFDIPAGALGFNIVGEAKRTDFDPNAPIGIERITDPSGKVVHDDFTPKGGTNPTSYAAFDSITSASVPQGEGISTDLSGTWKVRFGTYGGGTKTKLQGRVRVQSSSDGEFRGGRLNLHVHVPEGLFVDGARVDPAKAASNAGMKARLEAFFQLTSDLIGLERGEVVFSEAPASLASLEGNAIVSGFSVSKGEEDGAKVFHVLFTNEITQDGQPFAAGISPGIPGAASLFGRNVSGIIVATFRSAEEDAKTMAHEMGHFFGLNHTTELDGDASDPLSDTPVCSGISPQTLIDCPDVANLMFVTTAFPGPPTLSAKQKRVYRGSPIYEAVAGSRTMSAPLTPSARPPLASSKAVFRLSGNPRLSPVEADLALGDCGLTKIEPAFLIRRHGEAETLAQLRAAAADPDLLPYIRGRARLTLKKLGAR